MAVTPARKGHQFRYGFRLGNAVNTLRYWPVDVEQNALATVSADAYVTIYSSDGSTEVLTKTAMTVAADGSYTYALDLSNTTTWPIGRYYVKFSHDVAAGEYEAGKIMMGIYADIPDPLVTDSDITEVYYNANAYLDGRDSWADLIAEAWNRLLWKLSLEKRPDGEDLDPYDVADSTALYPLHKALTILAFADGLTTEDRDRFDRITERWAERFSVDYEALLKSRMDRWGETSGTVGEETRESSQIRGRFRRYGGDGADTDKATTRRVKESVTSWDTEY